MVSSELQGSDKTPMNTQNDEWIKLAFRCRVALLLACLESAYLLYSCLAAFYQAFPLCYTTFCEVGTAKEGHEESHEAKCFRSLIFIFIANCRYPRPKAGNSPSRRRDRSSSPSHRRKSASGSPRSSEDRRSASSSPKGSR